MQFTLEQQEAIKKALSILNNQPEIEFESWELDGDTVVIGNQAIQYWNEDGKVDYTLLEIKHCPGTYFDPPDVSYNEIMTNSFEVVLIELVKNIVIEDLVNVVYIEL